MVLWTIPDANSNPFILEEGYLENNVAFIGNRIKSQSNLTIVIFFFFVFIWNKIAILTMRKSHAESSTFIIYRNI